MDRNNRDDFNLEVVDVICDECESTFKVDALDEETLEDVECDECGHKDKLLVAQ